MPPAELLRQTRARLLLVGGLLLGLVLAMAASAAPPASAPPNARVGQALERALRGPAPVDGFAIGVVLRRDDLPAVGRSRRAPVHARQQRVLDRLPSGFHISRRYQMLSGFAGWADAASIDALRSHPEVDFVYLQPELRFTMAEGVPLIGGSTAHSMGYTGAGVNVAVIDSGIDTNHSDLMDNLVFEACFCDDDPHPTRGCCPNNDDEDTDPGAAEDLIGHGTQVSGVITSAGNVAAAGIAPDAGIVAIRIASPTYGPTFADAEAAMDWILVNRVLHDIEVVNLSFGDGGEYSSAAACAGSNFADAIKAAHDAGIIVFSSSGNDAHNGGIAFPACIEEVISVGGTYDAAVGSASWCTNASCSTTCTDNSISADQFVCHTNSGGLLDVLAPDWRTRTTAIGGGVANVGGTSFSSPYAAGEAAVLREADPTLTPTQMRSLMKAHGPLVTDPGNSMSFRRTDVALALISLVGTDTDSDGIFDDGDASGMAGDATCSGGATVACDDNCASIPNASQADGDADGAGDVCDACPGFDDGLDTDADGAPDGCDICPNDPFDDADADGVCGDVDVCPGFDDNLDTDADGAPDGCDLCANDPFDDADGDGVCGDVDICPGFDDNLDTDADGAPDGCDVCANDPFDDADGDGVCGDVDVCPGFDDSLDADADGAPDGCDLCANDPFDDADGDGVCGDVDVCPGFDDGLDGDGDGAPDGCDLCSGFDDGFDMDADGTPDGCDVCPNDPFDDEDADGLCGDVDVCPKDPLDDADGDGVCGDVDVCTGFDDSLDFDGDGAPDGCDADDDDDLLYDSAETETGVFVSRFDTGSLKHDPDSDDDSFSDGIEVIRGSDPNDPQSIPVFPLPALSPPALLLLPCALLGVAAWAFRRRRG